MRITALARLSFSFALVALARAADKCTLDAGAGLVFELPGGVHSASRKSDSPPATLHETIQFDLCAPLPKDANLPTDDQCPEGRTRACLTRTYSKGETQMIVSVIPVALEGQKNTSAPKKNRDGVHIGLTGGAYLRQEQRFAITLTCAVEAKDPEFVDYAHNEVTVEWALPEGCPIKRGDSPSGPQGSGVGSLRMFFLLFLLVIVAYFAIGSYYNYNTYGASGWDVIPHKDFWRELPFLLQDLGSHLCTAIRPRNRTGYVSISH